MLIVPVDRQPGWRRPPLITLLLIAVNCLVYFGLQVREDERIEDAYRYYAVSTLREIELPRYVRALADSGRARESAIAAKTLAAGEWRSVLLAMEDDKAFLKKLRESQVVAPGETTYQSWRRQRDEFDRLQGKRLVDRFAFSPAEPTLAAAFGHSFLHGSFDHLLGNMTVLFIFGYLVEATLGCWRFLAFYLTSALGGAGLALVVDADRSLPVMGAAGAVSGVVAIFVVLYGLRKIRFFYWLIVYGNYFRAPAIAVLPWWFANLLYQHQFDHGNPVDCLALLGGFITGVALVPASRAWRRIAEPAGASPSDRLPDDLVKVEKLLAVLRIDDARKLLRRLASENPYDVYVVGRYYTVGRNAPASADFHHAAALLFALPDQHPGGDQLIYETFVDYLKIAKPAVHFSPQQLVVLIRRLARSGHVEDAERLLRVLSSRAPRNAQLPGLSLVVAEAFRRAGNDTMRRVTLSRFRSDFPQRGEARSPA
jgi:membrane associated rhomboid family serine protease